MGVKWSVGHGRIAATLIALAAAVGVGSATAPAAVAAPAKCPWMDKSKSPEQRATEVVKAMSLDQKIHQLGQDIPPWVLYFGTAGHVSGTPALCIPDLVLSDAGSGVAGLQIGTTTFPSGVAQAAMFNPRLAEQFGRALGEEAFNKGINVMLSPSVNIARTSVNGRNFEYMGEDPFLAAHTAVAAIKGIQSNPVLAQIKHYAANNQETDRNTVDSIVDERTLREIYLPAFETAVKTGKVGSVMCSYNKLNGPYACENPELLDGYLRRDWGFDGFVTSDWGATHSTVASAMAGLNMEMNATPPLYYGSGLKQAVAGGKVPMARLDTMVKQVFVPMFRLGVFDNPPPGQPAGFLAQVSTTAHRDLARKMAIEGTVLLKNEGGILPIGKGTHRTIGVVGYAANPIGAYSTSGGGGSSKGTGLPLPVSPLEGLTQQALAHGDTILYADGSLGVDAAAVAAASDIVIAFASDSESEGADRKDLGLHPGICLLPTCISVPLEDQDRMVSSAVKANPNTVVVVNAGAPFAAPWVKDVKAIVDPFYPGTENGNAIAAILYGEANPSGKLPQTFPRKLGDGPLRTTAQYPGVNKKAHYTEKLEVGYRYFDAHGVAPQWPFGFGLSYTSFRFGDLEVAPTKTGARLKFSIKNTGKRTGAEVGQVYVGFPKSTGEPPRQLKGFKKIELDPGQKRSANIVLPARAFSIYSVAKKAWVQRKGCYRIAVGSSSRDRHLAGVVPIGGASCGPTTDQGCASRRLVVVNVRKLKGERIRSARAYVNGKRRAVANTAGSVTVRFNGRARTRTKVRIVATTRKGRKVTDRRTYRPCKAGAPT